MARKHRKARKKGTKQTPVQALDKQTIQRAAANALLSLTPEAVSKMCDDLDPDLGYQLVYAAANQTLQMFDGVARTGQIRSPTEMAVTVRHDPTLTHAETRYNFTEARFTIYTPEDPNLTVRSGDREVTKEEVLRNNLSESLPSAQLKLFYNQGRLLAQGNEEAYRNRYLPDQFQPSAHKPSPHPQKKRQKRALK